MRLAHLTGSAVLAGIIAAPPAAAAVPASPATAGGHGSAYGVSATGLVTLPATPAVASSGRRPARESVVKLSANPLVSASALSASAWAGHGRASVADLRIAKAMLTAEAVTARCVGGSGSSHLAKVVLNGRRLQASPAPNSAVTVSLDGLGKVTLVLNKQVRNPDGGLTVTAVELGLPPIAGKSQRVSIASVTCSPKGAAPMPTPTPSASMPSGPPRSTPPSTVPSPNTPLPHAPKPTPVPKDLAVTG
jgi:hypothetical protein